MALFRVGKNLVDPDAILCVVDASHGTQYAPVVKPGSIPDDLPGEWKRLAPFQRPVRVILRDGAGEIVIEQADELQAIREAIAAFPSLAEVAAALAEAPAVGQGQPEAARASGVAE